MANAKFAAYLDSLMHQVALVEDLKTVLTVVEEDNDRLRARIAEIVQLIDIEHQHAIEAVRDLNSRFGELAMRLDRVERKGGMSDK